MSRSACFVKKSVLEEKGNNCSIELINQETRKKKKIFMYACFGGLTKDKDAESLPVRRGVVSPAAINL